MDWEPCAQRILVVGTFFQDPSKASEDYAAFWRSAEEQNNRARRLKKKPSARAMSGRGVVMKPELRTTQVPPLKASRPGDRQPPFLGPCLQHVEWAKQLRRLQSFLRLAKVDILTAAHIAHQHSLWAAIRNTHGFAPSFCGGNQWSSGVGDPATVPLVPPPSGVAALFYVGLEVELISLN